LHQTEGVPVAINVGDYLIGKGYSLLSQISLDPVLMAECFTVVAASHLKLAEGQGADILLNSCIEEKSVEDVLHIFRLKTGEAVKVALMIGAIAGEAPDSEKKSLGKFSELFGIAYQIRDDLLEFREDISNDNFFDFPFLLTLLQQEMKENNSEFLKMLKENDLDLFRLNCSIFKIEKKADEYLQKFVDECYAELDNLQNQKVRLGLYGVMGKVFKQQNRGLPKE
jgi:geranylgeranyl diphosphate synthase, type II